MTKLVNTVLIALLAAASLSYSALALAQVYKWKDKNGVMQYSDSPPSTVKAQEVQAKAPPPKPVTPPSDAAVKKTGDSGDKLDKEAAKRQQSAEDTKNADLAKEAERKAKEANCATAKANHQTYKQGGRIMKVNEKGERVYLDDKAIAQGIADAKESMDKNCVE